MVYNSETYLEVLIENLSFLGFLKKLLLSISFLQAEAFWTLDADICYSCCRYFHIKLIMFYISCSIWVWVAGVTFGMFYLVVVGMNRDSIFMMNSYISILILFSVSLSSSVLSGCVWFNWRSEVSLFSIPGGSEFASYIDFIWLLVADVLGSYFYNSGDAYLIIVNNINLMTRINF